MEKVVDMTRIYRSMSIVGHSGHRGGEITSTLHFCNHPLVPTSLKHMLVALQRSGIRSSGRIAQLSSPNESRPVLPKS